MKWAYSIREKSKAAFLLGIVLVLVFGVNLIDRNNVSELGSSFSSVYEDRLVVESYIYKLSDYLYQKKIMMYSCTDNEQLILLQQKIKLHNEAIRKMIVNFEKTKLTEEEAFYLKEFKNEMAEILTLEASIVNSSASDPGLERKKPLVDQHVDKALSNLNLLSAIQVSEGKILNENSKRIIAGSTVMTQFELAILIAIGVLIQVLIFTSNSFKPKFSQRPNLN